MPSSHPARVSGVGGDYVECSSRVPFVSYSTTADMAFPSFSTSRLDLGVTNVSLFAGILLYLHLIQALAERLMCFKTLRFLNIQNKTKHNEDKNLAFNYLKYGRLK